MTQAGIARRVRRSRSSFYLAMRLMPARKREAMFAIYAFARALDDVADGPGSLADKRRSLGEWRAELARAYDGRPVTAVGQALAGAVAAYRLPREEFDALLLGMEMDIAGMRAPDLATLDLYCRRVAGTIGLMSLAVFECDGPPERQFAIELARALQLTNIARDLAEDATRGRLYVPRELLDQAGIGDGDPARIVAHPRLPEVRERLCDLARSAFAAAETRLAECPRPRRLWPALMMMGVYRRLLRAISTVAAQAVPPRIARPAQAWVALRVLILARP